MEIINVFGNEIKVESYNCKGKQCYRALVPAGEYKSHRKKYVTCNAASMDVLRTSVEHLLISKKNDLIPMTVEALSKEWLKYKFVRVSPATYDKIESVIKSHIIPEIGSYFLDELDLKFLQNYIDKLSYNGKKKQDTTNNKKLSYNTVLKIKSVLNEMINYAINMDYMRKNHLSGVTIPRNIEKPKEKRILTQESAERFLKEVNRKNILGEYVYFYRNAILFMLYTGLRTCEVFGLKKDMVNFEDKCVYITRNRIQVKNRGEGGTRVKGYKTVIVNDTKNASSKRIVPLSDAAFEVLVDACKKTKSSLCFPNANGQIVKPSSFEANFKRIIKKAGVDITPYSLRHSFACACFYNTDLSLENIAKIMGHSTTRVTYNTYVHQIADEEKKLSSKLNNLFSIDEN